jgi:phytoene dehydrogenase-like protein
MNNKYDVIIVGSGLGALSAASILAQMQNKKILILERHFKIGGFTHTFKREGKFEWDVGLHYIGEMHKGSISRSIFDFVTQGKVKWQSMPDVYDRFVYPDFTFNAVKGKHNFKKSLIEKFPDETKAINQYFVDLKKVAKWTRRYFISKTLQKFLFPIAKMMSYKDRKLALKTTGEYMDSTFKDPKLKAVLVSQWGDYGLPPSQSAFVIHAIVSGHYFNGGYYPVGGSKTIADSIIPLIEEKGGDALINQFVEKIIIKNGHAIGVKVKEKKGNDFINKEYFKNGHAIGVKVKEKKGNDFINKEYFADKIISNAGLHTTLNNLLPEKYDYLKKSLDEFQAPISHVTLYIGFKEDPRKLGFKGENYWIYDSYDQNSTFNKSDDSTFNKSDDIISGKIHMAYLSFPSLKNPKAIHHTAEIISTVNYNQFHKWENKEWKNRGEDYEKLKESISQSLIEYVNTRFPGFKELIEYHELSTPLSNKFFTGQETGSIYGIPATPERFNLKLINWRTPIKNLYFAGADTPAGHGIVGALMGGAVAAGVIMGVPSGLYKIFKESAKFSNSIN